MRRLLLFSVMFLVSIGLFGCSGGGKSKSTAPDWAALMLAEINSHRVGNELQYDPAIAAVALAHAQWLQANQALPTRYYSEVGVGGSSPSTRLTNAGVPFVSAAETGTYTNASVQGAYTQMSVATLTNTTYTHVGIAGIP